MNASDALSKPRRFFFRLILLAAPLLLLTAAELTLRATGRGGYPPFLRSSGKLPSGAEVCLVEPAASKPYFFANPSRPGYADQTNFLMPKPPGTLRIVLVGESAAKGYPQPRNLAMSAFLETMLGEHLPDRTIEVINLGTTAVASFPLVYATRDALAFDPDLVIFYIGNNEFFGAYGTESINAAGVNSPVGMKLVRAVRGLALAQTLSAWLYREPPVDRSLMEEMMGRAVVPPDAPSRAHAARNLRENLLAMLAATRDAGVPAIVCTTASNEGGMAPIGESVEALAAFRRAEQFAAQGDRTAAREAFLDARDLDPMPWRPTRATEDAIRDAASAADAPLCDIATIFRDESPNGAAGWDLVDDHVHLSVQGQIRAARAMAESALATLNLPSPTNAWPDWTDYAHRHGTNLYDAYRVHHTLRTLFGIPFMARANPDALARFETAVRLAEQRMPPPILAEAKRWQTMTPHAGGIRPLTGMAARVLLANNRPDLALPLYELAQQQVPDYTSWYLEYVYFALACREKRNGSLTPDDLAQAQHGIDQGRFLLAHGESTTGLTERYVARLHQLRGEWAEAIPMLLAARKKLFAEDKVAADQALVMSYLKTADAPAAAALIDDGIRHSGRFTPAYQQMKSLLPAP